MSGCQPLCFPNGANARFSEGEAGTGQEKRQQEKDEEEKWLSAIYGGVRLNIVAMLKRF